MFHILTAVLIVGPRGGSDGLQDAVGLGREPDIWTIRQEVIMTRIAAAVVELQLADPRKAQDAEDNQRRSTPPNSDMLLERILGNMKATPQEEVLKRIASLPDIRRGKVLRIHRQVTEGSYQIANGLDEAMDHVLEAITA
jgi:hypothetical protein